MRKAIPESVKTAARILEQNASFSEKLLWEKIKNKKAGAVIIRQTPIYVFTEDSGLDTYIIADFYCHERKVVIMLDSATNKKQNIYLLNEEKEKHLQNAGYKILRFNNEDIQKNMFKTVQKIHNM